MRHFSLILLACTALTACDLSPDFAMPAVDVPASFKEVSADDTTPITDGSWALANPQAAELFAKGEWWRSFSDETLDGLIAAAHAHNPTLDGARERLAMARAQTGVAEANLYPDIGFGTGVTRQQDSPANPFMPPGAALKPYTLYNAKATFDYGLDLFGRAHNSAFAALMREESQEQVFRAVKLNLEADVAASYYRLRALTAEAALLTNALGLREETLGITSKRYAIGDVSDLDVARAEGELATTKAELAEIERQRAVEEHTLAILTGKAPADFAVEAEAIIAPPPEVPAGIPSTLLERRPDIAEAQRELAARNAEIGLARAAFFPSIDLSAMGGFQSADLGDLFKWSSRTWLLGPVSGTQLTVPIFSGGRNTANLLLAKASYREGVAQYRSSVLTAFKETEDALAGIKSARTQVAAQDDAAQAAERAYKIASLQYQNGFIGYLDQIEAQRSLLAAQRGQVQSRGGQYIATLTLIRALGGGWDVAIPTAEAPSEQPAPAPKQAPKPSTPPTPPEPEAVAPAPAKPAALPFRTRNPNKPVPGFEAPTAPVMPDLDTENAPENTVLKPDRV